MVKFQFRTLLNTLVATAFALSAIFSQTISAQQIVTVDPGDAWLDASDGYREQITWRVASRGGAASPRGVFVDLDNNRELAAVDKVLDFSGDSGSVTESVQISAAQARKWYREGVRRLGYKRIFAGAAGSLSNRVQFDLEASGRLAKVNASPAQQTVSGKSRTLMLAWDIDSDIGNVSAYSVSGQFMAGDQVVYEVQQPLTADGGKQLNESVELPAGLVQEMVANGIFKLRYSRTFVDDKDTRRSASVDINLTP